MKVMGTTNHLALDLRPAPLQGTHGQNCKPSQKPVAGKVIGPGENLLLLSYYMDMLSVCFLKI